MDPWVCACLAPLVVWILLSGLDDLFIDLVYWLLKRNLTAPLAAPSPQPSERRIAVLVPLWHEEMVIRQMLERNLAAIRYSNYDFLVGVYPNDEPTAAEVENVARRNGRVHMAVCPHNGPTSKADCLNAAYAGMQSLEARSGIRFDVVAIHDAEDLIHPEALQLMNAYSREYEMVQVPVLPLGTPADEFTHGVYCDDFAEGQEKDLPVRVRLGGFLPSNGVGTAFSRSALDALAESRNGRVFDPECLTEDYEIGFALQAAGARQMFLPVRYDAAGPIATREYFPRRFRAAVRQRSRWVAGIAMQGWERHGWRAPWKQRYWLWRDRKGLVGNLITPLANLIGMYGLATLIVDGACGRAWSMSDAMPEWLEFLSGITFCVSAVQMGVKAHISAKVYGWRFGAAAPLRVFWANLVNCAATLSGLRQYARARLRRRALAWNKTEHIYPAKTAPEYMAQRSAIGTPSPAFPPVQSGSAG